MPNLVTIPHIASVLRQRQGQARSCNLLIGAGCSVSAGIPTAQGIVKHIEDHFSPFLIDVPKKTYGHCMAALPPGVRRDLLSSFAANSSAPLLNNSAHKGIAKLIRNRFVSRVLTTNFDSLIKAACARLKLKTLTYDLTLPWEYWPQASDETPIIHLHGRYTGRVLMNTEEQLATHWDDLRKSLGQPFKDAGRSGPWIVVGYSGENDPVLKLLEQVREYEHGLYWVRFKNEPPPRAVTDGLLSGSAYTYEVEGYCADSFFRDLANHLEPAV